MVLDDDSKESETIEFQRLETVQSMYNKKGVRFISNSPISLGVKSNFKLTLYAQDEMGKKILIDHLPHPSNDCLELLDYKQEKTIVASSHVTL